LQHGHRRGASPSKSSIRVAGSHSPHGYMPVEFQPGDHPPNGAALMLALRAIVAADGQHPVPSSREHASARASSTSRSFPDVGEFAHTQFIIAMLTATTTACSRPSERENSMTWRCG
jgi:hypothetical protein